MIVVEQRRLAQEELGQRHPHLAAAREGLDRGGVLRLVEAEPVQHLRGDQPQWVVQNGAEQAAEGKGRYRNQQQRGPRLIEALI